MAKKDNELEFAANGNPAEKLKALQAAMDKIEKSFGKGSMPCRGTSQTQSDTTCPCHMPMQERPIIPPRQKGRYESFSSCSCLLLRLILKFKLSYKYTQNID